MGTFPTTFHCFLREAQWQVGTMQDRKEERIEEGFLPGQQRQRKAG